MITSEMPLKVTIKLDTALVMSTRPVSLLLKERYCASHCLSWMPPAARQELAMYYLTRASSVVAALNKLFGDPTAYLSPKRTLARHCMPPQHCSSQAPSRRLPQPSTKLDFCRHDTVVGRILHEYRAIHDELVYQSGLAGEGRFAKGGRLAKGGWLAEEGVETKPLVGDGVGVKPLSSM